MRILLMSASLPEIEEIQYILNVEIRVMLYPIRRFSRSPQQILRIRSNAGKTGLTDPKSKLKDHELRALIFELETKPNPKPRM